jgi:AmiR/NasT family two-component response regulator
VGLLDDPQLGAMDGRLEVHQAQGMVTVDLGVDLAQALALMRAHAFSRDVALLELARHILEGERLPGAEED